MALDDDHAVHIGVKPWKYWTAVGVVHALILITTISTFFFPHLLGGVQIRNFYSPNAYPALFLVLVYWGISWQEAHLTQYAGVTVLGQPALPVRPGPIFVPKGIARLHRIPRDIIKMDFPAEPDKISRTPDDKPDLPGETVRPVRIQTGRPDDSGPDPLNVQMTLEPFWWVRWHVEASNIFDFIVRMQGKTWEEHRMYMQSLLRDVGETVLGEEFVKGPVYKVIDGLANTNTELTRRYKEAVEGYGIVIDQTGLPPPELPHRVNEALADISKSQASAKSVTINAGAERTRLTEEGLGRAAAKEAEVAAEGKGLKAAAEALGMTGAEYFAGDIAKNTIGKGSIIVGTDGVREAIGIGKMILGNGSGQPQQEPSNG